MTPGRIRRRVDPAQDRDDPEDGAGGPGLWHVGAEILDREAAHVAGEPREQLRQAVGLEALARVEQAAGHLRRLGVMAVAPEATGDQGVVVGPDRAGVIAERVVRDMVG